MSQNLHTNWIFRYLDVFSILSVLNEIDMAFHCFLSELLLHMKCVIYSLWIYVQEMKIACLFLAVDTSHIVLIFNSKSRMFFEILCTIFHYDTLTNYTV